MLCGLWEMGQHQVWGAHSGGDLGGEEAGKVARLPAPYKVSNAPISNFMESPAANSILRADSARAAPARAAWASWKCESVP